MKEYNYTLNTFKFFAMLCVIGIHTIIYSDVLSTIHFFLDSSYRIAVPIFFVINGYLIAPKFRNENNHIYIKNYVFKVSKIIAICSLLEVVFLYFKNNYILHNETTLLNMFHEVINLKTLYYGYDIGFFVPLWYLIATMYSLFIVYIFKNI